MYHGVQVILQHWRKLKASLLPGSNVAHHDFSYIQ